MSTPRTSWKSRTLAMLFGVVLASAVLLLLECIAGWCRPRPEPFLTFQQDGVAWRTREPGVVARGGLEPHSDRIAFREVKPPQELRVVVVGESTAAGFPMYPFFSFGRVAETLIARNEPKVPVAVVNLGRAADPTAEVLEVARAAVADADVLVVYCGHNEFQWPYCEPLRASTAGAWMHQLGESDLARWWAGASDREMRTPSRSDAGAPRRREGRRVADVPFLDERAFRRGLDRYARHVEAILESAAAHDVPVILCTQASNLADYAPAWSVFSDETLADVRADVEARLARWFAEPSSRQVAEAREMVELDGEVALAHYLLGRALAAAGETAEARDAFRRARDLDNYPNRASGSFNDALRQCAKRPGVRLLDAEALFDAWATGPAAGRDLFLDHCHPNVEATCRLGSALFDALWPELVRLGAVSGAPSEMPSVLTPDEVDGLLEECGISRRFLASRAVGAGQAVLLAWLQTPSTPDTLRLALLGFEEALGVDPGHATAWVGVSVVHLLLGEVEEALAASENARGLDPKTLENVAPLRALPAFQQALHQERLVWGSEGLQRATEGENDP